MTSPTAAAVAQRRARVAELTRDRRSIRDIAAELGVSKDVVHRDQQWLKRQKPATATATAPAGTATRHPLAHDKTAQAATALQQLRAAVTATVAARPVYQLYVDDATAAEWIAQLRQDVASLAAVADSFRDYYPHLTGPGATPHRDTATPTATPDTRPRHPAVSDPARTVETSHPRSQGC
ncbi:hypothetical protein ACFCYM_09805 [Streptomyces sp. NPDC056254]|uniref:hypothetical protein n=1 Tax=Streptomyces sp. NPDC056254 TaxID=3345763 RepID=UPI0035E2B85B